MQASQAALLARLADGAMASQSSDRDQDASQAKSPPALLPATASHAKNVDSSENASDRAGDLHTHSQDGAADGASPSTGASFQPNGDP